MLPPDEQLIEELTVAQYAIKNGNIRITDKDTMKDQLSRSPDRADALCLTFYPSDGMTYDEYLDERHGGDIPDDEQEEIGEQQDDLEDWEETA
jgi:hypothetical protein